MGDHRHHLQDDVRELAEISLRNLREHRDDTARWLAVEVLLADPVALEDDTLQERLISFQDRLEELARLRYGVPGAIGISRASRDR